MASSIYATSAIQSFFSRAKPCVEQDFIDVLYAKKMFKTYQAMSRSIKSNDKKAASLPPSPLVLTLKNMRKPLKGGGVMQGAEVQEIDRTEPLRKFVKKSNGLKIRMEM